MSIAKVTRLVAQIALQIILLLPGAEKWMELKSVCTELSPREMLITWPILNRFPNFKDQQTHATPDVLLALFLKKLTIPKQS